MMQQYLASNLPYANQKYDVDYLNKRIETLNQEMISQSSALINEYPEIAKAAKRQFSHDNFEKMSEEYDAKAKEKFQMRLDIYKNLAEPVEYKEAEKAWAEYFDVSLE